MIGFKQEVRNKLIGFGSHIQIGATFNNQTYETMPIKIEEMFSIGYLRQKASNMCRDFLPNRASSIPKETSKAFDDGCGAIMIGNSLNPICGKVRFLR